MRVVLGQAMLPDGLGRGFALVRALFLSATMAGVAPLFAAETGDAPAAAQQQPSADNPADDNQTAKQNYEPGQSTPPTAQSICDVLAATATSNDLPVDFFTRLIWQESRFKPDVVSTKGAQGIAQFMPMTALSSGLADPFNPREAIAKSGQLLRELHREFGNLGLAAAAYNAGPRRVHDWLGSHRPLPQETRAYVRLVTGHSVDEWAGDQSKPLDVPSAGAVPCHPSLGALLQPRPATSAPKPEQIKPWGVEVVGGPTPAKALARYREWQSRYTAILADREPRIVVRGVVGQMGAARVRVDEETRDGADRLCASLRAAGTYCEVWRN